MSEQEFIIETKKLDIEITDEMLHQLKIYATFLLEYNQHTNLTAIKTLGEIYLKHFYDSLTLTKLVNLKTGNLLDIGTGAGFPGLVLAIVFPRLNVTLLDSNQKKTNFLKQCIEKIHLQNVTVITARAEEYTKTHREMFDFVTSRAVAELRILLELNIPTLKINGVFLAMKGNILEELEKAQNCFHKLSCELVEKLEFELPKNTGHRTILKIIKQAKTRLEYPRIYAKIKKNPL